MGPMPDMYPADEGRPFASGPIQHTVWRSGSKNDIPLFAVRKDGKAAFDVVTEAEAAEKYGEGIRAAIALLPGSPR